MGILISLILLYEKYKREKSTYYPFIISLVISFPIRAEVLKLFLKILLKWGYLRIFPLYLRGSFIIFESFKMVTPGKVSFSQVRRCSPRQVLDGQCGQRNRCTSFISNGPRL